MNDLKWPGVITNVINRLLSLWVFVSKSEQSCEPCDIIAKYIEQKVILTCLHEIFFLADCVTVSLPTAQWLPRGYIFPTTAAGLSEQFKIHGTVARIIRTGHTGLQVHEYHKHAPPMLSENINVNINKNKTPNVC